MQKELTHLHTWLATGHAAVLAVVTQTWGSAPRPAGSLMIIQDTGHFEGSVSGGCVEGAVIAEAERLMGSADTKLLTFTVASEDAWQVGLACGGTIEIQLFSMQTNDAATIQQALATVENRAAGLLTLSKTGQPPAFTAKSHCENTPVSLKQAVSLKQTEQSLTLMLNPKPILCIVGAVHIAQALVPFAASCGFDITLIDPRGLFIDARAFNGADIIQDWPDTFFKKHPLVHASALVTLTHDPKIDDEALLCGLASPAFYIGSLGSRKTHAARLSRLSERGINAETLKRIHGPIGLNIGAKSPAEIAVSIMAEITAIRRGLDAA